MAFEPGFSVITGETGAGKSIIIGALSLILGQRADSRAIKEGEQKCVIEASFDITGYGLEAFFQENELDYDAANCLVRRELTAAGKSRAFVNDTPVPLAQLRELGNRLIDIHSQHENLLLSNEGYQLNVVDTIAQNASALSAYRDKYEAWRAARHELQQLRELAERQAADVEYMRFQHRQLEDAGLREGEQAELEQEQETLAHAEEIKSELQQAVRLLSDEGMALSMRRRTSSVSAGTASWISRTSISLTASPGARLRVSAASLARQRMALICSTKTRLSAGGMARFS